MYPLVSGIKAMFTILNGEYFHSSPIVFTCVLNILFSQLWVSDIKYVGWIRLLIRVFWPFCR